MTIIILSALSAQVATPTSKPYRGAVPPEADETPLTNMPPQAAGIIYGPAEGAIKFAHPGGLVVAGRDNYDDQGFKVVSSRGGTVLIYIDPVIDNSYGRYHRLLNQSSVCGPATTRWPDTPRVSRWGYLNDFRVGSVLQRKLACVLDIMVAENPQMAGWFADDVGSRSWFPGINWETWGGRNQRAYRAGAIALTKTFREVANRHRLVFMVNGTWGAGSLASAGGGYPNMKQHGNSLADGGFVEHHDGQIAYFGPYGCSSQWAAQSAVTHGKAFNFAVTVTRAGFEEFKDSDCYAYVNEQAYYKDAQAWGTPHATGLPSKVP